jgi:citrate synthase
MDIPLYRALRDIYFDTSEASPIDGENAALLYRGFNIHHLAECSTFEEVVVPSLLAYSGPQERG